MDLFNISQFLSLFLTLVLIEESASFLAGTIPGADIRNIKIRDALKDKGIHLQQALRDIRGKPKASPHRKNVKKTLQERSNGRVSFRECNLEEGRRLDCGLYGIDEEECSRRECCWGETQSEGVPWCYHSLPTIQSKCLMDHTERVECGWYGINKEQCLATDCCWQPGAGTDIPWCYAAREVPIFSGQCGVPAVSPTVLSRIVGGAEAKNHSWPWMVSLQIDGDHFCGGSLINDQWVVTAAHCEPAFWWGNTKEVVLGMHSQSSSESTQVRVEIDKIIAHEDYGRVSGMDSDIMLLKLEDKVQFTDAISPICLPKPNAETNPGKRCYTTGWGHTQFMGSAPDKLQQVMVPIIENSVCNEGDWYGGSVDESMVCAGYEEGGRDSCQGDSGGPLVCHNTQDREWVLSGIVSWGDGCAGERKPGVYAKTSMFIDWIQANINKNLD